jgi:hypothetical protein
VSGVRGPCSVLIKAAHWSFQWPLSPWHNTVSGDKMQHKSRRHVMLPSNRKSDVCMYILHMISAQRYITSRHFWIVTNTATQAGITALYQGRISSIPSDMITTLWTGSPTPRQSKSPAQGMEPIIFVTEAQKLRGRGGIVTVYSMYTAISPSCLQLLATCTRASVYAFKKTALRVR